MDIIKAERQFKIDIISDFLDKIYTQERRLNGLPNVSKWVRDWTAELLLEKLEQSEHEFEEASFEASQASHDDRALPF